MHRELRIGLPLPTAAIAFRPEFLDFQRGIRVGNLEDNQRITRILKLALESSYGQGFVTERWGRGVYWQWIGFLPRANRTAKPISAHVSFGCSKFFLMVDLQERLFKCGLQVERGYLKAPPEYRSCQLQPDWDWHRLLQALKPRSAMEHELKRLVLQEGFRLQAGSWEDAPGVFFKTNFPNMVTLRSELKAAPRNHWAGFQIFYPMREKEVRAATGVDLIESMMAVFKEVTPAMNLCMQIQLVCGV
ncbi:MAG: hypothetical protein DMG05_22390 [Acidobacteria bacterium]|nr:MAG: hypothetical protein DMG05_22390 [Acidobacteriota bacterium]